jgi:O-antigen/teichoic acid export membrane protein
MTINELSPPMPADALRRLADAELSTAARVGYVALLLAALIMTVVVGSLWATEPELPSRTRLAFAMMTGIGLAWAAFAGWVLRRRRVLLAGHRIVAGRMAVACTAFFVAGALLVGWTSGERAAFAAAAVGGVMLAAAVAILVRAHRDFARLSERRRELERRLGREVG